MALEWLRTSGFTVRLKTENVIGIAPVERLTPEQTRWIKACRSELLAELRDERRILAWLDFIHEFDPLCRSEVMKSCRLNHGAKAYFLNRAKEVPNESPKIVHGSELPLADCSSCSHQVRSAHNPTGGLSDCAIRSVNMKMPHIKRHCDCHSRCK